MSLGFLLWYIVLAVLSFSATELLFIGAMFLLAMIAGVASVIIFKDKA